MAQVIPGVLACCGAIKNAISPEHLFQNEKIVFLKTYF